MTTSTALTPHRLLPHDWHAAPVPDNVVLGEGSYLETSYSFHSFRSRQPDAVVLGRGASAYLGTTFDLGPDARVTLGDHTMINAAQLTIDGELHIGDHVLISWGVAIMDTYRVPVTAAARRAGEPADVRPVRIESDVWIGFGATILPGTELGRGVIVAARSVVGGIVPPHSTVAGNPAAVRDTVTSNPAAVRDTVTESRKANQ